MPPAPSAEATIAAILADPRFQAAVAVLDREHDRTVEDIVTLTEIPSPPFAEAARAAAYLAMLREHGLEEVEQDGIGNVMGRRRGTGNGATSWSPRIWTPSSPPAPMCGCGGRAPGCSPPVSATTPEISAVPRLHRAPWTSRHPHPGDILFVGDVGEEGLGDLRGVRHLFREGRHRDRIQAFFTVDSPDVDRIVTGGIGSKRYRVTFRGPGGHSFAAFGLVNPSYAMARAALILADLAAPGIRRPPIASACWAAAPR